MDNLHLLIFPILSIVCFCISHVNHAANEKEGIKEIRFLSWGFLVISVFCFFELAYYYIAASPLL